MADFDPESLSLEQATAMVLSLTPNIAESEVLPLAEACGRVLARNLQSAVNVPPSRNSAMDGYAVCFADLTLNEETRLQLIGKSLAGHPFEGAVIEGSAIRITTGALVPAGADCIIIQEHIVLDDDTLVIPAGAHRKGQFIREAGSDIRQDEIVLQKGTLLGAAEMGLIAAIGNEQVEVFRPSTAAVFSTGDELVAPGDTPAPGQIFDSNRFTLTGLLQRAGVDVIDLGIIPDSRDSLREAFDKASVCDLIISTGGVSVGEADYVRQILEEKGTLNMWKVAMKPGRPLTVGKLTDQCLFFGLPGNPVSGMVTFYLFVSAAIRKMQSQAQKHLISFDAECQNTLKKLPGRIEFQRGILSKRDDNKWQVETTGLQDSHVLSSMHKANCFIVLDLPSSGASVGDMVEVIPFEALS